MMPSKSALGACLAITTARTVQADAQIFDETRQKVNRNVVGIDVKITTYPHQLVLSKLRKGEIAAMMRASGRYDAFFEGGYDERWMQIDPSLEVPGVPRRWSAEEALSSLTL